MFLARKMHSLDRNYRGTAMPILTIRHVTTYRYKRPVAFGEHRMMLRPRDDDDQKVLYSELEITPAPRQLTWTQDIFGNHVATARFAERASELRFESAIRLDHAPADFRAADIENFAQTHPFAYAADDMPGVTPFIGPRSTHPELDRWAACFLRADGSANSRELLVDMTQTIKRTFKHVARHEKGIQDPVRTLTLARGSCRDLAVLMIAALRSLGIAARFVSVCILPMTSTTVQVAATPMPQVYVPGPGWVDFDPSTGMVGNQNLVRVAVVHEPREAICSLQGTWIGTASDHVAMMVAVKVATADAKAGVEHSAGAGTGR